MSTGLGIEADNDVRDATDEIDAIRRAVGMGPSREQIVAAAYVLRGHVYLEGRPDDAPDAFDIAEDMLESVFRLAVPTRPATFVVPEDVAWMNYRSGYPPRERWTVGLKAHNPEDDAARDGQGETFAEALAAARLTRGPGPLD